MEIYKKQWFKQDRSGFLSHLTVGTRRLVCHQICAPGVLLLPGTGFACNSVTPEGLPGARLMPFQLGEGM